MCTRIPSDNQPIDLRRKVLPEVVPQRTRFPKHQSKSTQKLTQDAMPKKVITLNTAIQEQICDCDISSATPTGDHETCMSA
jgi:hypothetical protein